MKVQLLLCEDFSLHLLENDYQLIDLSVIT